MAKHTASTSGSSNGGATASEAKSASKGKRGPSLTWNRERDVALVTVIRDNPGIGSDVIVASLQSHPAFEGAETLITRTKVTNRATTLRQAGVELPARLGGSGYNPEKIAGELNALLGSSGVGAGSDEAIEGVEDAEGVESAIA